MTAGGRASYAANPVQARRNWPAARCERVRIPVSHPAYPQGTPVPTGDKRKFEAIPYRRFAPRSTWAVVACAGRSVRTPDERRRASTPESRRAGSPPAAKRIGALAMIRRPTRAARTPAVQTSLRASMGLILSARRAGSMQASSPAPSITADVMPIQAANDTTSSAGRPVGPSPSATESSTRPPPAATPLHQHHGVGHDSGEHMAWVGAERHTHPDFARPPRHADRHQREQAHGRQKQHQRADARYCRDWRDHDNKIPLPDPCAE